MKRWGLIVAVATWAACTTFGVAGASAVTNFGNPCVGNQITDTLPNTFFAFAAMGDPLPLAAPSSGVITKWTMNSQVPATFQQTLKVVRKTGPETVLIVGESLGTIAPGTTSFDTRIPVQAGDLLGLYGTSEKTGGETIGNVFCELPGTGEVPIGAILGGGSGPGTSSPFVLIEAEAGFPVTAVLEPDADNDGFGDETQDQCPQSAATQGPCPVINVAKPPPVGLDSLSLASRRAISVYVATSLQAPVHVSGAVKLGKGATVTLDGGTQTVTPGSLTRFQLKLTNTVVKRLKQLPRDKKLTLNVTAAATNVAGQVSTDTSSVVLKGQKKAKRGKKGQKK